MAEDLVMKLGIEGIDDVTKQVESLGKGVTKAFDKIGGAAATAQTAFDKIGGALTTAGSGLDKITEELNKAGDTAAKFGEPGLKVAQALSAISDAAGPVKQGITAAQGAMGSMQQAFAAFSEGLAGVKASLVTLKTEAVAAAGSLKTFAAAEGFAAKTAVITTAINRVATAVNGVVAAFVPWLRALVLLEAAYEILRPLFGGMTQGLSTTEQMMRDLSVAALQLAINFDKAALAVARFFGNKAGIETSTQAREDHRKELAEVRQKYDAMAAKNRWRRRTSARTSARPPPTAPTRPPRRSSGRSKPPRNSKRSWRRSARRCGSRASAPRNTTASAARP
jgi:hypothetical protein